MESFDFVLSSSENAKTQAKKLTEILDFCGVSAEIKSVKNSQVLIIKINNDKLRQAKKRGAGRKQKLNYTGYSVAEVFDWQKQGVPLQEILERLEMKQATYYRRVKYYRENGYLDNEKWC